MRIVKSLSGIIIVIIMVIIVSCNINDNSPISSNTKVNTDAFVGGSYDRCYEEYRQNGGLCEFSNHHCIYLQDSQGNFMEWPRQGMLTIMGTTIDSDQFYCNISLSDYNLNNSPNSQGPLVPYGNFLYEICSPTINSNKLVCTSMSGGCQYSQQCTLRVGHSDQIVSCAD